MMASARKKWDKTGLDLPSIFSDNSLTEYDFYTEMDNEKETFIDKKFVETQNRSPLSKINRNSNESPRSLMLYNHDSLKPKSCPPKKFHNTQKTPITYHYDLRKTPDRLSRCSVNVINNNTSIESDEFTDAYESPLYVLRNHKVYAQKTSEHQLAVNSSVDRRETYLVPKSTKKSETFYSLNDSYVTNNRNYSHFATPKTDDSDVFETPAANNSLKKNIIDDKENINMERINFSLNNTSEIDNYSNFEHTLEQQETILENTMQEIEKRGSYVVSQSNFNINDLPHTPALRRSPRFIDSCSQSTSASESSDMFEVHYVQNKWKNQENEKTKKTAIFQRKTICQPFHLITDDKYPKINNNLVKNSSFTSSLRSDDSIISRKSVQSTIIKPFNLTESRKRFRDEGEGDKPFAEKIEDYFKTPKRFRSTSRLTVYNPPTKQNSPQFVRPKTPKLIAGKRRRQTSVLSHEQKLQLEAQQVKEFQFHAKAFNSALKNHPFVPKIEKKNCTIPKPFKLETQNRALTHKHDQSINEPSYEFHARKVPKSVLEGPKGLKERPSVPPTLPVSPKLSLKNREVKWKAFSSGTSSNEVFKFKAKPAPTPKAHVSLPKIPKKLATKPEPFSFHEKDKERFNKKEQKIEEEIKEQLKSFQFHAQDIPSSVLKPSGLSYIKKKSPTVPRPFNLRSSRRCSSFSQSYNEIPKVSNQVKFKAKPATVLKKRPFIPEKSLLPPIECVEFKLHTEERAIEREYLKEQRQSIEKEREVAAQIYKKEQERKEKEAIKELRQNLVHKPHPMPNYKHIQIKPSDKELTNPHSPKLLTKQRINSE